MKNKLYEHLAKGLVLEYPDHWEVEENEEAVAVFNPDGVGVLQLSTYVGGDIRMGLKKELESFLEEQRLLHIARSNSAFYR